MPKKSKSSSPRKSSQSSQGKSNKPDGAPAHEEGSSSESDQPGDQLGEVQQFIQDQNHLPASEALIWETRCLDLDKGKGLSAGKVWTLSEDALNQEKIRVAAMQSFCKDCGLSSEEFNQFRDLCQKGFSEIKAHGAGKCTLNDLVQYLCTKLVKDDRQNPKYISEDAIAKLGDRLKSLNNGDFTQKIVAVASSLTESKFGPSELQMIFALAYEIIGSPSLINLANLAVGSLAGMIHAGSSNTSLQFSDP